MKSFFLTIGNKLSKCPISESENIKNKKINDLEFYYDKNQNIYIEESTDVLKIFVLSKIGNQSSSDGDSYMNDIDNNLSNQVYCIITYNKISKTLLIQNNCVGVKPIFFCTMGECAYVSDDIYEIARAMSLSNKNRTLDLEAIYSMLAYGYLFEDKTLIKGVRKLPAGCYGKLVDKIWTVERYYTPPKKIAQISTEEAESQLDHLFRQAVRKEYGFSESHDDGYCATLSGGLDSRINIFVARDMGYKDFKTITFTQSGSLDDIISREIARKMEIDQQVVYLDNGESLSDFDNILEYNFGLVSIMGACHANYAFKSKNKYGKGLIHTGQLGDAIFGTYSFKSKNMILKDTGAGGEIRNYVSNVIDKYEDLSEFYLWNRGFNGIMNGFWILRQFGEPVSPFLDPEIINFSFTLERKLKKEQYLYLRWINRFYPQAAKFKWSRWGLRPTLSNHAMFNHPVKRKIFWPIRQYNRKRLRKYPHMNPFQKWYDENEHIKQAILRDIQEYRHLLPQDKKLQVIINGILDSGNITDIMALLTVVLFMKRVS